VSVEVRSRPWPGVDGKSTQHEIIVGHWPPIVTILDDDTPTPAYASWHGGRHQTADEVERLITGLQEALFIMNGGLDE
jgi:hypothetical protein